MLCYVAEDLVKSSDPNCTVARNGQVMLTALSRCQFQVASSLANKSIPKAAEKLDQLVTRKASGRFHVAIT